MESWRRCKLGEVITLKRGYDLPVQDRIFGIFPIVSSSGITGYHFESKVKGPGVVTGRYGTLGEAYFIENNFWPLNTSLYVCDFKGNNPRFISYLLGYLNIGSQNAAGAVPGVNRNHLHQIDVVVPPLKIQNEIEAVVLPFDQLIAVNRKRIEALESLARSLYREWFVKFRFPGHDCVRMVDSPMGKIPEGWFVLTVPESIEINPHVKIPIDGEKPFVPMGSLSNSSMLITDIETRFGNSGSKFQNGDTLFARITPCLENGKTGFVQFLPGPAAVAFGSTEFIVLRSKTLCPEFVYLLARSDEFRAHAIKSMSGATGRQRVQEKCFDLFRVAQPPRSVLEKFSAQVGPMFKMIFELDRIVFNLRRTRDLLLPRLLSGKIQLKDLDQAPIPSSEPPAAPPPAKSRKGSLVKVSA